MVGIISVVMGGHFSGGDHFDGGDHFGGGTGSHFQWSYWNGVAHFRILGVKKFFTFRVSKRTRMFVL